MKTIGILYAHPYKWNPDPRRVTMDEQKWNADLGDRIVRTAPANMIGIANPETPDSEGIYQRIALARRAHVDFAVELHHNLVSPTDTHPDASSYGLILYGSDAGRDLAQRLAAALAPVMTWCSPAAAGHPAIELGVTGPGTPWNRKAAIQDSPYPCVIIESAFMSSSLHDCYFANEELRQLYADKLRDTLCAIAKE